MGRTTTIYAVSLGDPLAIDEGYPVIKPTREFIEFLQEKYKTDCEWEFKEEGDIEYKSKYLYGEIDDIVKMLLEIAKEYERPITGTFMYHDDQTGGSFKGLVYIFGTQAIINEFNTDVIDISDMSLVYKRRNLSV